MKIKEEDSLAFKRPDLMDEWDSKNNTLLPTEVTCGSGLKAWWICKKCGGSYDTQICSRTSGHGCPYCRGLKVLKGFNDLLTLRPGIAEYWDGEKNGIGPDQVTIGTHKIYYWKCKNCGYEWSDSVNHRVHTKGCPACRYNKSANSGIRIATANHCLAVAYPDALKDWDYKKNQVNPENIVPGSEKVVWWKCHKCGVEYEKSVVGQVKSGCSYCKSFILQKGKNDLATLRPDMVRDWDWKKNGTLTPEDVTVRYSKRVHWKCHNCNSEYCKKICDQIRYGCSYCKGWRPIVGKTDLASRYPEVAKEWNYERNGDLRPEDILPMSTRKVWWRCSRCGREWQAYVENRTRDHNGCPSCQARTHTSFPEQALFYYLRKVFPDAINSYREPFGTQMELDIYIPSLKIAIEYDGKAWHKHKSDIDRDVKKYGICKENKIRLIRVVEGDESVKHCDLAIKSEYKAFEYKALDKSILELLHVLGKSIDIDSQRDEKTILESYLGRLEEESIQALYPEKCKSWDYEKNKTLKPNMFKPTSGVLVSWICPSCKAHYDRKIICQIIGTGLCKKCAIKEAAKRMHNTWLGRNGNITDKYPELAKQWDFKKNGALKPEDVTPHSSKRVWWLCDNPKCRHSWVTSVSNRTGGDWTGCPKCHKGRINTRDNKRDNR